MVYTTLRHYKLLKISKLLILIAVRGNQHAQRQIDLYLHPEKERDTTLNHNALIHHNSGQPFPLHFTSDILPIVKWCKPSKTLQRCYSLSLYNILDTQKDCTLLANPIVEGVTVISMHFCQLIGSTSFFFLPSFYCKTARAKQQTDMRIIEKI